MKPKTINVPVEMLEPSSIIQTSSHPAHTIRNSSGEEKLPPVFTHQNEANQRRVLVGTNVLQAAKDKGRGNVRAIRLNGKNSEALCAAFARAREVAPDDTPPKMIIRRLAEEIGMAADDLGRIVEDVPETADQQNVPETSFSDEPPEPQKRPSEPTSALEADLQKHELNIMPEMDEEDRGRVVKDMDQNGYDERRPIIMFEGQILDGWNRYLICKELGVEPEVEHFQGSRSDALQYVMRTNKRRNLTSSQWAAIAAEADELREQLETEARNRQGKRTDLEEDDQPCGKVSTMSDQKRESEDRKTREQLAERFNTNPRYVQDAQKLKQEVPKIFEQVKAGEKSISAAKKEQAKQATADTNGNDDSGSKPDKPGIPKQIIEAADHTLGGIDRAFCGQSEKGDSVPATHMCTSENEALSQVWSGTVFMYPNDDKDLSKWIHKALQAYTHGEVTEAILLLPSRTHSKWFNRLHPFPRYYVPETLGFPDHGSDSPMMVLHMGEDAAKFVKTWADLGYVYPGSYGVQWGPTPTPPLDEEVKHQTGLSAPVPDENVAHLS